MENKDELQELSLDEILTEFHDQPSEGAENVELGEELTHLLEALPDVEAMQAFAEKAAQEAQEAEKAMEERIAAVSDAETQRLETLDQLHPELMNGKAAPADLEGQTQRVSAQEPPAPPAGKPMEPQPAEGFDVDFIAKSGAWTAKTSPFSPPPRSKRLPIC